MNREIKIISKTLMTKASRISWGVTTKGVKTKGVTTKAFTVLNNDLILKFNDTINKITVTDNDLYIKIYGSLTYYDFTWTASFQDSSNILIKMNINSEITGTGEKVYVEFTNTNNLKSIYSLRQTNPDISLNGLLNQIQLVQASSSLGQTTLFIFLFSVGISMISSFGGNSMELMWLFTNNLQLIYYISAINVNFPDIINEYFPYVQIWNANNPYLSRVSYLIIPEANFKRGDVNNSIGPKSFYVSWSDKIPLLVLIFIIFIILKLTDFWYLKSDIKWINYVFKFIASLKYNFFLRIWIELMLEVSFNAIVNIYFVSIFNVIYRVTSQAYMRLYLSQWLHYSLVFYCM